MVLNRKQTITIFSNRAKAILIATMLIATIAISAFAMLPQVKAQTIDPTTIPKFTNQLTGPPPVYTPTIISSPEGKGIAMYYEVTMDEQSQQVLPTVDEDGNPTGFGLTNVWGYGGQAHDAITGADLGYILNSPGPSFEAMRGIPSVVKWINNIDSDYMFAIDPTLHWANPNGIPMPGETDAPESPFPAYPPGFDGTYDATTNPYSYNAQNPAALVPHLHGGEVSSKYDGGPTAWWTNSGTQGSTYNTLYNTASNAAVYYYPNEQPSATLWYHDHALGLTRINVMSGLAGFYLLRDNNPIDNKLAAGNKVFEMPIVIQDRTFKENGQFDFPSEGNVPDVHPYWQPEFFGDTIMVNGLVWPNMDVDQGTYRLRLLDGSNARFYTLSFVANPDTEDEVTLPFIQIGTDGGFMKEPVTITELTIAPGERADVLVDFSGLAPETKVLVKNTANAPFPGGSDENNADPETTGQIMQFTVTDKVVKPVFNVPKVLNADLKGTWPTLPEPTNTRTLTLWEVLTPGDEPLEVLVNGQKWDAATSELPHEGSTEEWVIVNLTGDTHPIHLHLVQFQLVSRQDVKVEGEGNYVDAWLAANEGNGIDDGDVPPYTTVNEVPVGPYLIDGTKTGPAANEYAWKDTIQMSPGQATTIRVRFAPIDGSSSYPFDPTDGPGYVWHCHIIDHEDNEMMRPYEVIT